MAGLVDDVKALRDDLLTSSSVDDRNIAERLAEMVDRYEVPLTPLDANMGAATHRPGHTTERAAADLALPKAGTLRQMILAALSRSTRPGFYIAGGEELIHKPMGLTQEETARYLKRRHYSVAPRFAELARMGWIRDSGRTRPTSSDTQAIVWEFTEAGYRAWEAQT